MRKIVLGLAAGAALLTAGAVPAMAQIDFYAGPGGVGVGIGPPVYGYDDGYYGRYYGYDYGAPGVYVSPGWHGHHHYRHYEYRR